MTRKEKSLVLILVVPGRVGMKIYSQESKEHGVQSHLFSEHEERKQHEKALIQAAECSKSNTRVGTLADARASSISRSCADRCHFALTSKSFLSIFDFGVNHSYFAPVMTKLTMLQIDVAPSIFTRFLSCLLHYHRTTRALLLFALR